jgi:hypothetical protein
LVYPGTTIEVVKIEKSGSRRLFDGIFAAGGITLSQICTMTGLEPYTIQNWVKRGFVSSPVKRMYSRGQFARIVVINMLKDVLLLDQICELVRNIGHSDGGIADDELYHTYVDMVAQGLIDLDHSDAILAASKKAASELVRRISIDCDTAKLTDIIRALIYASAANSLQRSAQLIISNLD